VLGNGLISTLSDERAGRKGNKRGISYLAVVKNSF
jgi:hypothetical protein